MATVILLPRFYRAQDERLDFGESQAATPLPEGWQEDRRGRAFLKPFQSHHDELFEVAAPAQAAEGWQVEASRQVRRPSHLVAQDDVFSLAIAIGFGWIHEDRRFLATVSKIRQEELPTAPAQAVASAELGWIDEPRRRRISPPRQWLASDLEGKLSTQALASQRTPEPYIPARLERP